VFMAEQYGTPGEEKPGTYAPDPMQPIGSWKTAWKNARRAAGSNADSTIFGIAPLRGYWKPACRSRSLRVSWVGVQARRRRWRSDMDTSAAPHTERPSQPSIQAQNRVAGAQNSAQTRRAQETRSP
jgi:hypothetical protein